MCRIVGVAFKNSSFSVIGAMTDSLEYGGPDDRGVWNDESIALGHRRLSIIDLSPLGHQPMLSPSGRYVIAFNGEIYNFKVLRTDLEQKGVYFKGHSDTEVILAAVEIWGFNETMRKLNGMFAIALWDRQEKKLYLARDRFGEKPLYYGIVNGAFIFASELKAICLYPEFKKKINMQAVQLLLRYAYIQAPYSIYEGICKLEPGHYLMIDDRLKIQKHCYWSAIDTALNAKAKGTHLSFDEVVDELERRLLDSVKMRCISDVPLGAFLSGGIDSSTIVALMQKISSRPVKTFSIGFDHKAYDEAPFAKAVAEHLGTEHHEFYVSEQDALNVIPDLATIYDEPFADSSQIPTFLVSKLAKQHVTVVLSGDAGDELCGGYQRYFLYQKLQYMYALPAWLREAIGYSLKKIPDFLIGPRYSSRLKKLAAILRDSEGKTSLYDRLISQNRCAENYLRGGVKNFMSLDQSIFALDPLEKTMLWDTTSYLSGDILTKVDRASMAVALETRIPFLDHHLFEYLWSLPLDFKVKNNEGKIILKELLYRYVPKKIVDRPKMGFGIPIDNWLRGPLRAWADSLIQDAKKGHIIQGVELDVAWARHLKGENMGYLLWNILMFQEWANQNG